MVQRVYLLDDLFSQQWICLFNKVIINHIVMLCGDLWFFLTNKKPNKQTLINKIHYSVFVLIGMIM